MNLKQADGEDGGWSEHVNSHNRDCVSACSARSTVRVRVHLRLLTIPIPPCSAMAMAICASVTVSMGDDTNGSVSLMFLVRYERSDTSSTEKSM